MFVGTYGTLRSGKGLHGALGSSSFCGFFRPNMYDALLLRTPAGYPAFVQPQHAYLEHLVQSNLEWQDEMELSSDARDAITSRTGWNSNLDTPLLEVYAVSGATADRLDIVEGVPHLYTRRPIAMHPVQQDTITRIPSAGAWRRHLQEIEELVEPKMRMDRVGSARNNVPNRCIVYEMQPESDWLQGCPIIWNGDFCNPYEREGLVFNYNAFMAEIEEDQVEAAARELERGLRRAPRRRNIIMEDEVDQARQEHTWYTHDDVIETTAGTPARFTRTDTST